MENEVVKKKNNVVLIILLILIILGLCGYIAYDKLFEKKDAVNNGEVNNNVNSNIEKKDTLVFDEATKKELLELMGLTENGLERYSKEDVQSWGFDTNYEYADFAYYGIAANFIKLQQGEYDPKDLDIELKKIIIWRSPLTKGKTVDIDSKENEYHPCYAGSGHCDGITIDTYKAVAKRYGFSDNPLAVFDDEYDGYYLLNFGGSVINPYRIEDKLSYDVKNNEYYIVYEVRLTGIGSTADEKDYYKAVTFVFNSDKNLSRIIVRNLVRK